MHEEQRSFLRSLAMTVVAIGGIGTADAQTGETSDAVHSLLACRAVASDQERLRCLDSRVAELHQQVERGDIVVATRAEIAHTQTTQFGRSQPAVLVPERPRQPAPAPLRDIDTSIRNVTRTADGKWVMVLADGARWQQIDGRTLAQDPRPGMKIAIRRAAMGSFLANVAGQTAMRVRRID